MSTEEAIINAFSNVATQLTTELRTAFAELSGNIATELRTELRTGFSQINERIDQTNARLDQTNARLDQTNTRLDQTITRLDQTIIRLDSFQSEVLTRLDRLEESQEETCKKLDGISKFLIAAEKNNAILESRILNLERRVGDIEKQKPA